MSRKDARRRRSPERQQLTAELVAGESLNDAQRAAIEHAYAADELRAGETFSVIAGDDERNAGDSETQRVGVLRVNTVEVDPASLDAEADGLLASSPPELTGEVPPVTAQPGAGELVDNAGRGSWNEVTPGLVAAADIILLPQWNLRTDEKEQLSRAFGDVLDQVFPGGLSDPRWAPYVRLIAVASAIAFSRIDPATGKLPGFGAMKKAENQVTRDGSAAAAGADARKAA